MKNVERNGQSVALSQDVQTYTDLLNKHYSKLEKKFKKRQKKVYNVLIFLVGLLIADIIYIVVALKFM